MTRRPTPCCSSTTTRTCAATSSVCSPPRFNVMTAADGEEALARVGRTLPDLVLTDVMMPRLDGFGLLKALRGNERTRDIPVVLLSARAGEESRIEGIDAGADDYLVKPFSARELHARGRNNLAMARARTTYLSCRTRKRGAQIVSAYARRCASRRSLGRGDRRIAVERIGRELGATWAGYGIVERDHRTLRVVAHGATRGARARARRALRHRTLRRDRSQARRRVHRHRGHAAARACRDLA